jgi:hypothetical protein
MPISPILGQQHLHLPCSKLNRGHDPCLPGRAGDGGRQQAAGPVRPGRNPGSSRTATTSALFRRNRDDQTRASQGFIRPVNALSSTIQHRFNGSGDLLGWRSPIKKFSVWPCRLGKPRKLKGRLHVGNGSPRSAAPGNIRPNWRRERYKAGPCRATDAARLTRGPMPITGTLRSSSCAVINFRL